jgi:hypothetical protein
VKWVKVFSVFVGLHVLAWVGTHVWLSINPRVNVVIADTSFSMRPHFSAMQTWIEDYADDVRYTRVVVGTDRAIIGPLDELRSTDDIFRTSFGRSSPEALAALRDSSADEHIVLTDGSLSASGWTAVRFGE